MRPTELLARPPAERYLCAGCGEEQLLWAGAPPEDLRCPDCQAGAAHHPPDVRAQLTAGGVPPRYLTARDELRLGRAVPRRAATWRGDPPSLLLWGPSGGGKSTLAVALLAELAEAGLRPAYVTAGRLMLELGEEYSGERRGVLRCYIDAGALVLDDVGKEPVRRDVAPSLHLVVDERLSNLRPTIFATNLPLHRRDGSKGRTVEEPSLEDYDSALLSRLSSGEVVNLDPGEDLRLARGAR